MRRGEGEGARGSERGWCGEGVGRWRARTARWSSARGRARTWGAVGDEGEGGAEALGGTPGE